MIQPFQSVKVHYASAFITASPETCVLNSRVLMSLRRTYNPVISCCWSVKVVELLGTVSFETVLFI